MGIERKSRNRRSIGVQTCAKGLGTGRESKGCDPKKVPWERGGGGGGSAHACKGGRELSLYVEAYLLRTYFLSTPKPDFQTHTTVFSLGVPCFSKATVRKNWSLSWGWGGCTGQSLPINKSSVLPPPRPAHPMSAQFQGSRGQADHRLGEYLSARGVCRHRDWVSST